MDRNENRLSQHGHCINRLTLQAGLVTELALFAALYLPPEFFNCHFYSWVKMSTIYGFQQAIIFDLGKPGRDVLLGSGVNHGSSLEYLHLDLSHNVKSSPIHAKQR